MYMNMEKLHYINWKLKYTKKKKNWELNEEAKKKKSARKMGKKSLLKGLKLWVNIKRKI